MNKMIGFVVTHGASSPVVTSVRRTKEGYIHKAYRSPTFTSLHRISLLSYQKEYKMTMTSAGLSFHLQRSFYV